MSTNPASTRSRRPAGTPTGGQFAPGVHAEPEITLESTPSTYVVATSKTGRSMGRCESCRRPVSVPNDAVAGGKGQCPDCGRMVPVEPIVGVVTAMACDARCKAATGKRCDCSCGGVNHGGAWSGKQEMLESELAAYHQAEQARMERREARQSAERRSVAERRAAFVAANEETVRWIENSESDFAQSLRRQLDRQGYLSERQIEAAQRIESREAERAARDAAAPPPAPIPETGTLDIPVTILGTRVVDGWRGREQVKMLVAWDHAAGRSKLWMTMPSAMLGERWQNGDQVTIRGEVTVSEQDATFGFVRRPRLPKATTPSAIDAALPDIEDLAEDLDDDS